MSSLRWVDSLGVAVEAIRGHRSRSVLTVLSVVIGVASILFCVSAGTSLARFLDDQLSSLGSDLMWVRPRVDTSDSNLRTEPLTAADAAALARVPGIGRVGPRASDRRVVRHGTLHMSADVLAVGPQYFPIRNKRIGHGRPLLDADVAQRRAVCVIGPGVLDRLLYQTSDPVGRGITIDGQPFLVVGVLARSDVALKAPGLEEEDAVFVPVSTGARQLGLSDLDFIFFQPDGSESRAEVGQRIHQLLLLRKGARAAYDVESLDDRMQQVETLLWMAILVFGSIAAVALVVAGIGIMNIMLLSVIERTREIGIRKSVGARRGHILLQFSIEAVLLSSGGGALGVLLGAAGIGVLSLVTSGVIGVSWSAAAAAFAFSVCAGVFFGLYPALRAARLDPAVALAREAT